MTRFYDRNGRPLPLLVWATLLEQATYRQVARDVVASTVDTARGLHVSTIWQGFDATLVAPAGGELIYETVVVGVSSSGAREILCKRWAATEKQALAMHDDSVAWAREQLGPSVVIPDPTVPARSPRWGWAVPSSRHPRERGKCRACGRQIRQTAGGRLTAHGQQSLRPWPRCQGTRMLPTITFE